MGGSYEETKDAEEAAYVDSFFLPGGILDPDGDDVANKDQIEGESIDQGIEPLRATTPLNISTTAATSSLEVSSFRHPGHHDGAPLEIPTAAATLEYPWMLGRLSTLAEEAVDEYEQRCAARRDFVSVQAETSSHQPDSLRLTSHSITFPAMSHLGSRDGGTKNESRLPMSIGSSRNSSPWSDPLATGDRYALLSNPAATTTPVETIKQSFPSKTVNPPFPDDLISPQLEMSDAFVSSAVASILLDTTNPLPAPPLCVLESAPLPAPLSSSLSESNLHQEHVQTRKEARPRGQGPTAPPPGFERASHAIATRGPSTTFPEIDTDSSLKGATVLSGAIVDTSAISAAAPARVRNQRRRTPQGLAVGASHAVAGRSATSNKNGATVHKSHSLFQSQQRRRQRHAQASTDIRSISSEELQSSMKPIKERRPADKATVTTPTSGAEKKQASTTNKQRGRGSDQRKKAAVSPTSSFENRRPVGSFSKGKRHQVIAAKTAMDEDVAGPTNNGLNDRRNEAASTALPQIEPDLPVHIEFSKPRSDLGIGPTLDQSDSQISCMIHHPWKLDVIQNDPMDSTAVSANDIVASSSYATVPAHRMVASSSELPINPQLHLADDLERMTLSATSFVKESPSSSPMLVTTPTESEDGYQSHEERAPIDLAKKKKKRPNSHDGSFGRVNASQSSSRNDLQPLSTMRKGKRQLQESAKKRKHLPFSIAEKANTLNGPSRHAGAEIAATALSAMTLPILVSGWAVLFETFCGWMRWIGDVYEVIIMSFHPIYALTGLVAAFFAKWTYLFVLALRNTLFLALDEMLQQDGATFCYCVLYVMPFACDGLMQRISLPHYTPHVLSNILIYILCRPPTKKAINLQQRKSKSNIYSDMLATDMCRASLRLVRLVLPANFAIEGFATKNMSFMMLPGEVRLLCAYGLSLVRMGLILSPVAWVGWSAQVLIAAYLPHGVLRQYVQLLVGLAMLRLTTLLQQPSASASKTSGSSSAANTWTSRI